jgi:hypothetical protein
MISLKSFFSNLDKNKNIIKCKLVLLKNNVTQNIARLSLIILHKTRVFEASMCLFGCNNTGRWNSSIYFIKFIKDGMGSEREREREIYLED